MNLHHVVLPNGTFCDVGAIVGTVKATSVDPPSGSTPGRAVCFVTNNYEWNSSITDMLQ